MVRALPSLLPPAGTFRRGNGAEQGGLCACFKFPPTSDLHGMEAKGVVLDKYMADACVW